MLVSHTVKVCNETSYCRGGYVVVTESQSVSTVHAVARIRSTTVTTQLSHRSNPVSLQAYSSTPAQ